MNKIQKQPSALATGIVLRKTKISTDKRQGVIEEINIFPLRNQFQIKYRVERLDSNNLPFADVYYKTKTLIFKDEGEIGEADFDENGIEVPGTYVKVKDEVLNVTDWNVQLGTAILGSAIAYVEGIELL